jgi:hypothetical protein
MGAVSRNEVKFDPTAWSCEPFQYQHSMMVSGIIKKNVNEPFGGIHDHDRHQKSDGALGIHGKNFQHFGVTGLKINRAVNI